MERRVYKKIAEMNGYVLVMDSNLNGEDAMYIVCAKFNEGKANPFESVGMETKFFSRAINYMLGFTDEITARRYKELLNCLMEKFVDEKDDEELNELAEDLGMDEDEREHFNFPDNNKYDIVEVTFKRSFLCTKRLVVPSGTEKYNLDNYFNPENIDDCDFTDADPWGCNTEIERFDTEESELSKSELEDEDYENEIDDFE